MMSRAIYFASRRGEQGTIAKLSVSLLTAILIFGIKWDRFSVAYNVDKVLVKFPAVKHGYQDWSDCCILSIVF